MTQSYIFRKEINECADDDALRDFVVVDTVLRALALARPLCEHFGVGGFLRIAAKSLVGNRALYIVMREGRIVSRGALSIGFCSHYNVSRGDVVIGSIWTDERCRGEGLATRGVRSAIQYMSKKGAHVFFIDTQEANAAMLKSISKLGFGEPVGVFQS